MLSPYMKQIRFVFKGLECLTSAKFQASFAMLMRPMPFSDITQYRVVTVYNYYMAPRNIPEEHRSAALPFHTL
jgi:hypothetical protein